MEAGSSSRLMLASWSWVQHCIASSLCQIQSKMRELTHCITRIAKEYWQNSSIKFVSDAIRH
jgi:hypothetical protein